MPRVESDDHYNFVVDGKVRRIPVDGSLRERLVRGELVIVRCDGHYDLVPAAEAPRIRRTRPEDPSRAAEAAPELGKLAVFQGVDEFPVRVKCASLAWHTMKAALEGGDRASTE